MSHFKGKSFFITGVTGFLGSRVLMKVLEEGGFAYCLRRSQSNLKRVSHLEAQIAWVELEKFNEESFFYNNPIDCIIHCATDYGKKSVSPMSTVDANLILPIKLLHYASQAGTSVFINTDTVLNKDLNNYSLSKGQFNEWLQFYSKKISSVNIALQHFYGPDDDETKFVSNIINELVNGVDRIKLSPGEQERDFVYIDDVMSAFALILEKTFSENSRSGYAKYEIGTGHTHTVRKFVELCKSLVENCNTKLDFGALPYRVNELMKAETDLASLKSLGWKPTIQLREGLLKTVEHYKSEVLCDI